MATKQHRIIIKGEYVDNISKKFLKMTKQLKKRFRSVTASMTKGFRSVGSAATSAFRLIRKAARTVVIAVAAITAGLTAAALSTARFTEGLLEIKTLGVTKAVGQLRDEVLALTAAYGQESAETIKAYYDAISAGVKQSRVVVFLGAAAEAAIAGVTDLATATDGLTSVLNAYQLTADKASIVADAFFGAIKAGKTTFTELAASIGMVAPLAAAAGVPLKELFAVVAAITKSGLKTENAITGVKAMLTQLIKPGAAAIAAAKRLGIEWGASALQAKGLAGILQELAENSKVNIEATSELFGNVRGLGPALGLMAGDAKILKGAMRELEASTGAVSKAFAIMSKDNVALQWRQLKEEVKGVWVLFGATFIDQFSGVLGAITDGVKGIKNALTEMDLSGYFEKAGDAVRGFVNHIAKAITGKDELLKGKKGSRKLFSKFRDDVIEPEQVRGSLREEIRERGALRRSRILSRAFARRLRGRPTDTTAVAAKVEKVVESGVKWLIDTAIPAMQMGFDKVFAYIKDGKLKRDWQSFSIAVNTTLNLVSSIFTKIADGLSLVDKAFRNYNENLLKAEIKKKAQLDDPRRKGTLFEPSPTDFGPSGIAKFFRGLLSDPERTLGGILPRQAAQGTATQVAAPSTMSFAPVINIDGASGDPEQLARDVLGEMERMYFGGTGELDWMRRAVRTQ